MFTGDRGFRRSEISGYFQDTFKVTSMLTFNLGLRYENYIGWPWTEVYNRMYQWVPSQQTVLQVGTNGIPASSVYGRDDNFTPRVGLAYRLRSTTVFRAAAGVFYSERGNYGDRTAGFVCPVAARNSRRPHGSVALRVKSRECGVSIRWQSTCPP